MAIILIPGAQSAAVSTHLTDVRAHVSDAVSLAPTGGAVATDADDGDYFAFTMDDDLTLSDPTGTAIAGQKIMWAVTQDGVGGHTLTFDSGFNLGNDLAAVTNTVTADATDYIGAVYNGSEWHVIAFLRGY